MTAAGPQVIQTRRYVHYELRVLQQAIDVARVIVDSAKVEVQFMNVMGGSGTGFIPGPTEDEKPAAPKLIRGGRA